MEVEQEQDPQQLDAYRRNGGSGMLLALLADFVIRALFSKKLSCPPMRALRKAGINPHIRGVICNWLRSRTFGLCFL